MRDTPTATHKWNIRIPGYGTFQFDGTEDEAYAKGEMKRRWEGSTSMLIWRDDLSREQDRIAHKMSELFDQKKGVPVSLIRKRARLRRDDASSSEAAL